MVPVGDPEDDGDQLEPPDRVMPDEVDYFIGFETVTHIGNERLRRVRVSYYQWAPLILLVQGLCFYIPFLIWNSCAHNAGVKLRRLLKKASDIASLPPGCQQREALLAEFVDQFHTLVTGEAGWCVDVPCVSSATGASTNNTQAITDNNYQTSSTTTTSSTVSNNNNNTATLARGNHALARNSAHNNHHHHQHQHQQPNNQANNNQQDDASSTSGTAAINQQQQQQQQQVGCCLSGVPIIGSLLCCWLRPCCAPFNLIGPSKYLCLLYLAVKSFYVFNVGLQFFLLGTFLGRGYLRHGLELINRLIVSGDWWASPRFPLSTLCQVRADMSGGLRSYTCQCVLPINVFNEKIFSVVWFYMAFLMPLNVLSLLYWIYRTLPTNRLAYIRLCLWRTRLVELNQIHRTVRRLSQSYLGWDGVFLLRLIEHNHGSIMATLIMSRLWEFYANQMKLQEDANALQLANNAHNTLSQTTTAYNSQQQQIIAAAAAAAQQQQQQQQHQHQQHHHGHNNNQQHANHHHHNHNSSSQQQQQQQPHHGGHHHHQHSHHHNSNHNSQHQLLSQHHHNNSHHHPPPPPPPANALAAHFAANNQSVVNTQNAAPFNSSSANHHSGQVSQAGSGHHGLHAANAHHALNSVQLPANFATSQASANLLAHLQQAGANNTLLAAVAAQNQATAGNQGNVSAVLACLAPKAAVQTNTSGQQVPGAHHAQQSAAVASQQQLQQQLTTTQQQQQQQQSLASSTAQAAAASAAAAAAVASALASSANTNSQSAQHHHHHSQQQNPTSTTSFITNNPAAAAAVVAAAAAAAASSVPVANEGLVPQASGPPLPPPPPAHVVAAAAAAAANSAAITATSSVPVNARSRNATNNQQHATTVSANNNQQSLSNNSDHNQQQQQLNQTQGGQASAASVFGANLKSSNQTPAQKTKR